MNKAGGVGASALGVAGNIADAINPPNAYGRQSMATNVLKNAGTFASMGSAFGPVGMAVGAGLGVVKGVVDGVNQRKAENKAKTYDAFSSQQNAMARYSAQVAADPSSVQGKVGAQYFADGGSMTPSTGSLYAEFIKKKTTGGSLQRLSSDSVEVKGPSHENGGVGLPGNNEVEGGETIKDNYVFSDRLGFADLHKPIARAIGKLEQKPASTPVINSLRRLRQREDALQVLQEHVRQQNNLA
jgi:hypothetical protein